MEREIILNFNSLLLQEDILNDPNANVLVSPYSVIMLLAMMAHSSNGRTRSEILNAISSDMDISELENMVVELLDTFTSISGVNSANAFLINERLKQDILSEYRENYKRVFKGNIISSKNLVEDVNAWVKRNTKGMIDRVLKSWNKNTVACLINAISFEKKWLKEYDEDDVIEGDFDNADGSVSEVDMLCSNEHSYYEDEVFCAFAKAYKGNEYSYLAMLPKEESAEVNYLIKEVDISKIYREMKDVKVNVVIPEYESDYSIDLTSSCKNIGIAEAFTSNADFSNICEKGLMIDSIFHKAAIKVDRHGTKAAAVTYSVVTLGLPPEEEIKEIILDRPFIYAIVDNKRGLPLFIGTVNKIK